MANWKNGTVNINGNLMDYIAFGKGEKHIIMIPGVGDGLKTVKGMAFPFSMLYRKIGAEFRVHAFSRRRQIPEGYTTKEMAEDCYQAASLLGIEKAHIIGVSQGGMIAQHLAAEHPELVEKLVLAVTTDRLEKEYRKGVEDWIDMARRGDYAGIMMDTAERSYSESYLKKARLMYGIITRVGKPKIFDRFMVQAQSCLDHDSSSLLSKIHCPALILGGAIDRIVGAEGSFRLAEGISGAELHMYEQYGHGAYEEAKDFEERIAAFLR